MRKKRKKVKEQTMAHSEMPNNHVLLLSFSIDIKLIMYLIVSRIIVEANIYNTDQLQYFDGATLSHYCQPCSKYR